MIVSEVEALTNVVAGMAQVKQLTAGSIHHQYQYQSESEYLALPNLISISHCDCNCNSDQ